MDVKSLTRKELQCHDHFFFTFLSVSRDVRPRKDGEVAEDGEND